MKNVQCKYTFGLEDETQQGKNDRTRNVLRLRRQNSAKSLLVNSHARWFRETDVTQTDCDSIRLQVQKESEITKINTKYSPSNSTCIQIGLPTRIYTVFGE